MHPRSPNARRARASLRLANFAFDEVELDLMKGENKTATYLALNPMGKVPTLERLGETPLWESHAIASFAARGTDALPSDRVDEVHRWQLFDAAHFSRPLGTLTFQRMFAKEADEAAVDGALQEYARYAAVVEAALEGPFLLGDQVSIADVGLVCSLTYADATGVPLDDTPKLAAWRARVEELAALNETRPG